MKTCKDFKCSYWVYEEYYDISISTADAEPANVCVSLDDCDKKTLKSDGWIFKRSHPLSPSYSIHIHHLRESQEWTLSLERIWRFLQCLMEHSENHSNVSSSWWHPIAPITRETHEGMPLPSVNELLNCITPWKSRNKAITCDLSTFRRARLKTVLKTASLVVLVCCWTWLSFESLKNKNKKKLLVFHQL